MTKFNLTASITVSVYTVVEAETIEKAIIIAEDRDVEKLEYGQKEASKHSWVNDELDGSVFNITQE